MKLHRLGFVMIAAGAGGCMHAPDPGVVTTMVASAKVTNLIGLSQAQVLTRLGMPASSDVIVTDALRLDRDTRVAETQLDYMIGGKCAPAEGDRRSVYRAVPQGVKLVFHDEKLVSATADTISVTCVTAQVKSTFFSKSKDMLAGAAGMANSALSTLRDDRDAQALRDFSDLRLGEAPRGGPDFWAKVHSAQLRKGPQGEAELEVSVDSKPVTARLLDDKVVELRVSNAAPCVMRADHSLKCS
ncbi:MAG TPA: hypothetical protein VG942_02120 [Hyphomonadaceae bacterium]|nr:hypothetical protein [Hyphomonadaceae bacterium]